MTDLSLFTDPDKMMAVFQRRLDGFSNGGQIITRCEIEYAHFRPHRKARKICLCVCYRLSVRKSRAEGESIQRLYGKAYVGGRSHIEFDALQRPKSADSRSAQTPVHLPDLDLIIWTFPDDPRMPQLVELIDPKTVVKYFPYEHFPPGLGTPRDIRHVEAEVVHYRPEFRCLIRYQIQWGPSEDRQEITIFGKTFYDHSGKEILNRVKYFWQKYGEDANGVMVAEPLGYDHTVKTIWQIGLEGTPVQRVLDQSNHETLLNAIARGLAILHESELFELPRVSVGEHLEEVGKKATKLGHAYPHFTERLRSIIDCLEHTVPGPSPNRHRPIHFDFTVKQLLSCRDQVAFFDFDELALGDPAQDLANFIVDLHFCAFDSQLLQSMTAAFCEAYGRHVAWDMPLERLRWYAQIAFINKAYRSYIQQQPGKTEVIDQILVSAQRRIDLRDIDAWIGEETDRA